jgi:hypothetical protein
MPDHPAGPWLLNLPRPADAAPGRLPADTLGVGLSGGGIRSAAFCLGVLQALARAGWLPRVDFLSTVSGGGYVGTFLGRFFDLGAKPDGLGGALPNLTPGSTQARVARDLADSRSAPLAWLRRHANYLSPTGRGELSTGLAAYWRNLLSIYVVLGVLLFAAFGLLNALAYLPGGGVGWFVRAYTPFTPLTATFLDRPTPWAVLCELVVWLAVVPLALAHWVVTVDRPAAFRPPVLLAAAVVAAGVLIATGSPLGVAVVAAAVAWALATWGVIRKREGHFDPHHPARLALARTHLTAGLALAFSVAAGLGAFAAIDAAGKALATWVIDCGGMTPLNMGGWLTAGATGVVGLASVLRMIAGLFTGPTRRPGVWAVARPHLLAALVVLLGGVPPLVAVAFAAHSAYAVGDMYFVGLAVTAAALVVSLLLGRRSCVPFINRSGPLGIYAARLGRAFLGAVNPARRTHPEGANVAYVVPGDDVSFREYAPHAAGGPLHLINCAVNETVDVASQRTVRDRQAENMAVGPAGVSVAQRWHAVWEANGANGPRLLRPLAEPREAAPHPFLARDERPVAVEELFLREWVAISGGALSPASGRRTGLAHALLFTLGNLRLGYWWDSGLWAEQRASVPARGGVTPWLLGRFTGLFHTQALLLAELVGRFAGPWERFWAVSDGGNFEVTGAYELLRRRVPFVVVCDAGQDPLHAGEDFARLVRLARVDLGAEIADADLTVVPVEVRVKLAPVAALLANPAAAHAALLKVTYPPPADPDTWAGRSHTWLLYLKATLTGDEPADVANYAAEHPDFPNESTLDQFFDEPQWESYRQLGDHIGGGVFG